MIVAPFSAAQIRAQLTAISKSATFAGAHQLKRLLEHVVTLALAERVDELREMPIGVELFDSAYDPKADNTVRVRAGELRVRLREYYEGEGANDLIRVEIPGPGYVPSFFKNQRSPVVGRDEAVATMTEWYHGANQRGMLGCVAGEEGIGKTTLIKGFLNTVRSSAIIARSGHQEQGRAAETYAPIVDALKNLLVTNSRLTKRVQTLAPLWFSIMTDASDRTSLPRERMKHQLLALLHYCRDRGPVVLVLDDFHAADPLSVDLVEHIANHFDHLNVLILVAYRPYLLRRNNSDFLGVHARLTARNECAELALDPITREDITDLLATLYPGNDFPQDLASCLYNKTEGNPQLVMLATRRLEANELLKESDGVWRLACGIDVVEEELPHSGRELVEDKIRALPRDLDRHLLKAASRQGLYFDSHILAEVVGMDPAEIEDDYLEKLEQHHALVKTQGPHPLLDGTPNRRYRFTHERYWSVITDLIGPARNHQLARLTAAALTHHAGEHIASIAYELARLHEASGATGDALTNYGLAVQNKLRFFAHPEVIKISEEALSLLKRQPHATGNNRKELAFLNYLGLAIMTVEGFAAKRVVEVYTRAADICRELQDPREMLNALFGLYVYHVDSGNLPAALALAEDLFAQATAVGDEPMLVEAFYARGIARLQTGALLEAQADLQSAITTHKPAFRTSNLFFYQLDPAISARCHLARVLFFLGHPDQGLREAQDALRRASEQHHPESRAYAYVFAADLCHLRRDPAMTLTYSTAGIRDCEEQGLIQELSWIKMVHLWALGEQAEGAALLDIIAQLRQHIRHYRERVGCEVALTKFLAIQAQLCARAGQPQEGLAGLHEALRLIYGTDGKPGNNEHYYEAEVERLIGELLIRDGDPVGATDHLTRALAIAERQHARTFALRAITSLYRLQRQVGIATTEHERLRTMLASFTEGHNTVDFREAAALFKRPPTAVIAEKSLSPPKAG